MSGRVIHLSPDGISTPLGQAQVLAVCERLQKLGWRCSVLSIEPAGATEADLRRIAVRTAEHRIDWQHRVRHVGPHGALRNAASMAALLRAAGSHADLFHCRSYFGAFFPGLRSAFGGAPYVFDTRGYWVDEKIEGGRWFQDAATRAIARRVERQLYDRAAGVVCLTELAARDVRNGLFGKAHPADRSICIPTCVDYHRFTLARGNCPHPFLSGGPIIAYVGSLNPSYEYRKSLELASTILDRMPTARFLALTSQVDEMASLAESFSISTDRRLITSVPHEKMHEWMPWIDFGLMLLVKANRAKRASMPTKLAEFFATGVAPIAHGANQEVTDWVDRVGSGLALDDLSAASLERAADFVARGLPAESTLAEARLLAQDHFSLDSGAARYDALFRRILS